MPIFPPFARAVRPPLEGFKKTQLVTKVKSGRVLSVRLRLDTGLANQLQPRERSRPAGGLFLLAPGELGLELADIDDGGLELQGCPPAVGGA